MSEKFKHLQSIPVELNDEVEAKLKDSIIPSKTYLINKLLTGFVKGEIKI